nr:Uncharacterised protein [Salmonella sp. NCTC 7297]
MELLLLSNSTLPGKAWLGTRSAADSESVERSTLSRVYSICRRHANMG